MISKLRLQNFRQFEDLKLDFNEKLVIIFGDNTKGKSTILEALSTITTGNSPFGDMNDLYKKDQDEDDKYFRIEITAEVNGDKTTYAYFKEGSKRILQLNGSNTTAKKFFEKISSIIFNPEQIEILMISSSKRREFIDSLILQTDIEYRETLSKFRQILRQRNAYLKKLSKLFYESGVIKSEDPQLKYWTEKFAEVSATIVKKRSETINQLKTKDFTLEYISSLKLGQFEDVLDEKTLIDKHKETLIDGVKAEIAVGHTRVGAHRDDWKIFNGKDIKRFGSRGEKRIAIIQLIFYALKLIAEKKGFEPYLLLDDTPSELDKSNISLILDDEHINNQQTFITSIEKSSIPEKMQKEAQIIDLNIL